MQLDLGLKANGKYRYFWLYKVKFSVPATNLATKGDNITFSTPTIEGTVLRRNKLDGQGKHPWKAEVNEDDTNVPLQLLQAGILKFMSQPLQKQTKEVLYYG